MPNIVVEMCFILQLLTVEGKSDQENGIVQYTQQFLKNSYFNFDPLTRFNVCLFSWPTHMKFLSCPLFLRECVCV